MGPKIISKLAGLAVRLFAKKPPRKKLADMEFKSSTQKIGVSFNDKIRNIFRKRWLKPKK